MLSVKNSPCHFQALAENARFSGGLVRKPLFSGRQNHASMPILSVNHRAKAILSNCSDPAAAGHCRRIKVDDLALRETVRSP
ncbi:MAG: hypothetical protein ACJASV_000143 [Pseudorhodobacter sp.]|jgi:hypothetical protein